MTARRDDEPSYGIRVAASLVASHPQTLRMYEREGLVCPRRSQGNVRLYSERDIARIRRIQSYTELGVNLAGVEIIFRLLERVEQLEERLSARQAAAQHELEDELTERLRTRLRQRESER